LKFPLSTGQRSPCLCPWERKRGKINGERGKGSRATTRKKIERRARKRGRIGRGDRARHDPHLVINWEVTSPNAGRKKGKIGPSALSLSKAKIIRNKKKGLLFHPTEEFPPKGEGAKGDRKGSVLAFLIEKKGGCMWGRDKEGSRRNARVINSILGRKKD